MRETTAGAGATDLSEQLVDALNGTYGVHPGHRAAHAKGVLAAGWFTATAAARELSRAPHFSGERLRAHVRFSNGGGDPSVPDGTRDGRGIAVKIYLPDGTTTDLIGLSLPVFFVRTPAELIAFNEARRPNPETGAPDLDKVGVFLGEHPEALPAVGAALSAPIPASYAQVTYHGIHAFTLVAADGTRRHVRYRFTPAAGEASITDEDAAARPPDYLRDELEQRLAAGEVEMRIEAVLAAEGDPIDDPTAQWPDDRETVRLGTLAVTNLAFDRERDGDVLVFDPSRVPDGIELTGDQILLARSGAYRVSVTRRTAAGP